MPEDSKQLYEKMSNYIRSQRLVDSLIKQLAEKDRMKSGFLKESEIVESIKMNKMNISSK